MISETVGKYRVVGPLGQGSTGVVYKAVRQETNQPVVLKAVAPQGLPTDDLREQFTEEAEAALLLNHPRLRQLFDVMEKDGQLYLALEYLEGATLKNLLVSGPVEVGAALAWGAELADGLAAAHEAGVVHGELTSAKVFITQEGTVKLLDAGLWRLSVPTGVDLSEEANLRQAGLSAATVAALAPEQLSGSEPDPRSDIFALGALVYQMVTGRHPFAEASVVDTMYCVLRRAPPPASEIAPQAPLALDAVLARALEKDPEKRCASASELAAALRAVATGEGMPVRAPAAEEASSEKPAPQKVVVIRAAWGAMLPFLFALGAVAALLVLWFLYLALTQP